MSGEKDQGTKVSLLCLQQCLCMDKHKKKWKNENS